MKIAAFLVISCLFASAFTLTTTETLRKIAEGEFGRTLLDTIQLEFKASTTADPRPRILQLLQEIKDEALAAVGELNKNHAAQQDKCSQNKKAIEDAIEALNSQNAAASAEILSKQDELGSVTSERNAKQAVVDTLQPYLDRITEQRNKDQAAFEAEDNRQAQIISVLEKTRKFITDRLDSRGAGAAFLERENVLLQVKDTVMSSEFQRMSPGWGQLISFLATKALHKLSQNEDTQAIAGLQSIVDLINQIIADTSVFKSSAQATNTAAKEAFEKESADIQNKLTLAKTDIGSNDARILNIQGRVKELSDSIESNNKILENKKEEQYQNDRECTNSEDEFAKTIKARNAELDLINQVIAIVRDDLSNLRDFTEGKIKNSDIVV